MYIRKVYGSQAEVKAHRRESQMSPKRPMHAPPTETP